MSSIFGGKQTTNTQQSTNNAASLSNNASINSAINGSTNSSVNGSSNSSVNESSNSANSDSSSSNLAYPMLSQALGGQVTNGTTASNDLSALLGVGGDPAAQQAALQNWQNSTGYQFGMNQGTDAVTGSNAAKGLLNSGSALKALDTYGQNYANTQYQNYLNPLMSLISSGNQAAGTISGAGGVSNSSSSSNGSSYGASNGSSYGASNGSSYGLSNGASVGQSTSVANGQSTGSGQSSETPDLSKFIGGLK